MRYLSASVQPGCAQHSRDGRAGQAEGRCKAGGRLGQRRALQGRTWESCSRVCTAARIHAEPAHRRDPCRHSFCPNRPVKRCLLPAVWAISSCLAAHGSLLLVPRTAGRPLAALAASLHRWRRSRSGLASCPGPPPCRKAASAAGLPAAACVAALLPGASPHEGRQLSAAPAPRPGGPAGGRAGTRPPARGHRAAVWRRAVPPAAAPPRQPGPAERGGRVSQLQVSL